MKIRVLTADDVRRCLQMNEAIDLMDTAFAALSDGSIQSPIRTLISNQRGTMLYKPVYWPAANIFCCKTVSVFAGNADKSIPVTAGVIQVNDADTGFPIALIDAGYVTSLRTGAATGLATRLLSDPNARTAALFGTGGQARHQLEALLAVRKLSTCFIYASRLASAEAFCLDHHQLAGDCRLVATDSNDDLAGCEVVVTATTHPTPLFRHQELSSRVHVNAIGSLGQRRREIPTETVLAAEVIVDQREACLAEAGEFCIARDEGRLADSFHPVERGELVSGARPIPESPLTLFKSVGNAAQDIVCVRHILEVAEQDKLGQFLEL